MGPVPRPRPERVVPVGVVFLLVEGRTHHPPCNRSGIAAQRPQAGEVLVVEQAPPECLHPEGRYGPPHRREAERREHCPRIEEDAVTEKTVVPVVDAVVRIWITEVAHPEEDAIGPVAQGDPGPAAEAEPLVVEAVPPHERLMLLVEPGLLAQRLARAHFPRAIARAPGGPDVDRPQGEGTLVGCDRHEVADAGSRCMEGVAVVLYEPRRSRVVRELRLVDHVHEQFGTCPALLAEVKRSRARVFGEGPAVGGGERGVSPVVATKIGRVARARPPPHKAAHLPEAWGVPVVHDRALEGRTVDRVVLRPVDREEGARGLVPTEVWLLLHDLGGEAVGMGHPEIGPEGLQPRGSREGRELFALPETGGVKGYPGRKRRAGRYLEGENLEVQRQLGRGLAGRAHREPPCVAPRPRFARNGYLHPEHLVAARQQREGRGDGAAAGAGFPKGDERGRGLTGGQSDQFILDRRAVEGGLKKRGNRPPRDGPPKSRGS